MFVNSNLANDLKKHFISSLLSVYKARELENIYFLIHDLEFSRNRIEARQVDLRMSESELLFWNSAIKRLKKKEPVQYILGFTYFYDCKLKVNKHTLIPRPETEELVQLVLRENPGSNEVLDIGTGSGCIPIAIKKNKPHWNVQGLDVSEEAVSVANFNSELNNVEVDFRVCDILASDLESRYDIIISNPPYIPFKDKTMMAPNVLKYEPSLALFVENDDPLLFYNRIGELGMKHLNENGILYFEIHENYSTEVQSALKKIGYNSINIHKDLQGKERVVSAQKV